jgi:hypothetical protein
MASFRQDPCNDLGTALSHVTVAHSGVAWSLCPDLRILTARGRTQTPTEPHGKGAVSRTHNMARPSGSHQGGTPAIWESQAGSDLT